jgi:hypothetical protein
MPCSDLPRFTRGLLLAALLAGCVVTDPIDDDTTEATTTAATGPDGDTTLGASSTPITAGDATAETGTTAATGPITDDGDSSDTDESTDTGPASACPGVPEFQCSNPTGCFMLPCGDVLYPFDAEGCMRPPCINPDECNADQFCFRPYEAYGVCVSSGTACSDGPDGTCECVSTPDCSGGYCMPDCYELSDDPASCGAAGCYSSPVVAISEACECTADVPGCFQSPAGIGVDTGYIWHEETLEVVYIGQRPWSAPLRWRLCSDPEAPPACGCFDLAQPPECP